MWLSGRRILPGKELARAKSSRWEKDLSVLFTFSDPALCLDLSHLFLQPPVYIYLKLAICQELKFYQKLNQTSKRENSQSSSFSLIILKCQPISDSAKLQLTLTSFSQFPLHPGIPMPFNNTQCSQASPSKSHSFLTSITLCTCLVDITPKIIIVVAQSNFIPSIFFKPRPPKKCVGERKAKSSTMISNLCP